MAYVPPHKRHQQGAGRSSGNDEAEPDVGAIFANPFTAPPATVAPPSFGGGINPFTGGGLKPALGGNPFKKAPQQPTDVSIPPLDPDTLDGNIELQKEIWDEMTKALKGVVNKVCVSNMMAVTVEAFRENIHRGRGVFVKALMGAQAANDEMSPVFACLVALINKFVPQVGELLVHRLLAQWKKIYWRGVVDRTSALLKFLGHLMIQKVVDDLLIMKILIFYLSGQSSVGTESGDVGDEANEDERLPSESDILTAVALFKEVFPYLQATNQEAFSMILEPLRDLVNGEGKKRITIKAESVIEQLLVQIKDWELNQKPSKKFGARLNSKQADVEKSKVKRIIPEGLDLLEDDEGRVTHEIDLDDEHLTDDHLDVFRHDPNFEKNEEAYDAIRLEALGEELAEAAMGRGAAVGEDEDDDYGEGEDVGEQRTEEQEVKSDQAIKTEGGENADDENPDDEEEVEYADSDEEDVGPTTGKRTEGESTLTDDQIIEMKKQMYLLMKNSLRAEEVVHKFFKHLGAQLEKHEDIAVNLLMEACYREKTYNKKHVLIAERLAKKNPKYQKAFDDLFDSVFLEKVQDIGDRDIEKVGWYFGTLLATNSIHWSVLAVVQLGNGFITDSSRLAVSQRIFLQALFKKLVELLKLPNLAATLNSPKLARITQGMFPKEDRESARLAFNFYESIGVGLVAQPLATWYESTRGKRGREDE